MRLNRGIAVALATFGMVGGATEALAGTISQWTFPSVTPAPDNSPAPTIGTGVATVLGMTNNYTFSSGNTITGSGTFTYTTLYSIGSVASADVLATASDPNGDANAWRVRGPSNNPGQPPGMGNGWALQAPQYTQGVQFSSSTVGYSGVGFHFDWYTTAQAVNRLQEQYTLNGTTWNNINPVLSAPSGGGWLSETIDFSGISSASGNSAFGVRLVSVYDTALAIPNYGSASGGYYNNNSGNWRFTDITFTGNAVPEPSSFVLSFIGVSGLAGLFGWRRSRGR